MFGYCKPWIITPLKEYKLDDIIKTMRWLNYQEFEMGWSLETVRKYVDDTLSPECDVNKIIFEKEDKEKMG
jgi:hypothetical protein